jgi:hypothetical protein
VRFPRVGDVLFLNRDGVYVMDAGGAVYKLSSDIKVEQRNPLYWHVDPDSGSYAGLEREK